MNEKMNSDDEKKFNDFVVKSLFFIVFAMSVNSNKNIIIACFNAEKLMMLTFAVGLLLSYFKIGNTRLVIIVSGIIGLLFGVLYIVTDMSNLYGKYMKTTGFMLE